MYHSHGDYLWYCGFWLRLLQSCTTLTQSLSGPIVPVLSFTSVDEAIAAANDSPMGLGASVWSDDVAKAEAIGLRLEVGMVYVNSFEKPDCHGYMSGHKMSGIGGDSGVLGIKEMCNVQVMHTYKRS